MGKMLNIVGMVALAMVVAGGAFAGFLFATGRLNAQRLDTIAQVLRGKLDAPAAATSQPTTTAPTSAPAEEVRGRAADEADAFRERRYVESLEVDRARRDLEAQRLLLSQVLQNVVEERERFAREQQDFTKQRAAAAAGALDQGFQKELDYLTRITPKLAKEHLVNLWKKEPADAVRLFVALDTGRGKRILETFKTPDEIKLMSELLEQVRLQSPEGNAETSGTTTGAAKP